MPRVNEQFACVIDSEPIVIQLVRIVKEMGACVRSQALSVNEKVGCGNDLLARVNDSVGSVIDLLT